MQRLRPLLLAALLVAACGRETAEPVEEFGPEQARALIPEAAGLDPKALGTIVGLGRTATEADMIAIADGVPLTLAVLAYAMPSGDPERDRDFHSPAVGPLLNGFDVEANACGMHMWDRAKHSYCSLLLPEHLREVTCERNGGEARGTVSFSCTAPSGAVAYEGRVEWVARRAAGGWRIEEFRLPGHRMRVFLSDGKWKAEDEAHPGRPPRRHTTGETVVASSALARVGRSVDPPADAFEITVPADGRIVVRGKAVDLDRLSEVPWDVRGDSMHSRPEFPWLGDVVLRIDSSGPWAVVPWVIQKCSASPVLAYRFHFAVLAEADGEERVLACPLSKDEEADATADDLVVGLKSDSMEPAPAAALDFMRARLAGKKTSSVLVEVAPGVAAGNVMRTVDLLRRAGATRVLFAVPAEPAPTGEMADGKTPLQRWVAGHPVRQAGWSITVNGETLAHGKAAPGPR